MGGPVYFLPFFVLFVVCFLFVVVVCGFSFLYFIVLVAAARLFFEFSQFFFCNEGAYCRIILYCCCYTFCEEWV